MRVLWFLLVALCVVGCRQKRSELTIVRAAYYWKSDFWRSWGQSPGVVLADSVRAQSVYIKFFDVDWDAMRGEAVPLDRQDISAYNYRDTAGGRFEIIPTIFITNRTLVQTDSAHIGQLAGRLSKKLIKMIGQMDYYSLTSSEAADQPVPRPKLPNETVARRIGRIQIDCDWTPSTRARYFDLLRDLKMMLQPCELSVTVRLYPFKYPEKMGVPPVDRAMLMCYNLRPFNKLEDKNSILDLATARAYLTDAKPYPLPLDVALPVFSWGVLFRGGKFRGLINNLSTRDIKQLGYFRPEGTLTYVSQADTSFYSMFLRRGDVLRIDQASADDLKALAELTRPLTTPRSRVALFSLDTATFSHYPYAQLQEVYDSYR